LWVGAASLHSQLPAMNCLLPGPPLPSLPAELELKHGLLQVADGLHFLHSEAGLVHRGIAPTSILITQSGARCAALCFVMLCCGVPCCALL